MFSGLWLRLTLRYTFVFGLVLVAFGLATYGFVQGALYRGADEDAHLVTQGVSETVKVVGDRLTINRADFDDEAKEASLFHGVVALEVCDAQGRALLKHGAGFQLPALGRDEARTLIIENNPMRLHTDPILDHGRTLGYIRVVRPISDIERTLRGFAIALGGLIPVSLLVTFGVGAVMALQATRPIQMAFDRLRRFTADASHELRTPLAVIQTQTDVILAAPPRDEAALRRAFEPIQRSGKKMAGLVADLLFLARSDASSVEIQAIPLDFDELVEDVVEDHAAIARNKGISLTFEGDRVPLKGDPQRLQQLVTNLIENALKYTDRGEVRVRLTRANGHPHGLLQVSDTGPGIEAKHLPHVFGRFYRTNAARSSDKPGTGLGLAIVKAIALAHKGSVSVESEPGKGSTFSVRLPLA